MTNWHLLTFGGGDSNYREAAKRLAAEGAESQFFSTSNAVLDIELNTTYPDLIQNHGGFMANNVRGYGYWIWKPYLIYNRMIELRDGDGLLYLDAGCQLNLESLASRVRMRYYQHLAKKHGSLAWRLQPSFGWHEDLSEKAWSKQKLLDKFKLSQDALDSNQIQASLMLFTKNSNNLEFCREWLELCRYDDYKLLNDQNSESNYLGFQEHRHDQSIFSCLYKESNRKVINDQTWFAPDWEKDGKRFPIWTIRNRSGLHQS